VNNGQVCIGIMADREKPPGESGRGGTLPVNEPTLLLPHRHDKEGHNDGLATYVKVALGIEPGGQSPLGRPATWQVLRHGQDNDPCEKIADIEWTKDAGLRSVILENSSAARSPGNADRSVGGQIGGLPEG
jgi:hypothetical protein